IGWLDDLRGLPSALRFAVYGLGVALFLFWMRAELVQGLGLPGGLWAGAAAVLLWLALLWLLNLFNFMDGINGITGMEAMFALLAASLLAADAGAGFRFALWGSAAAVAGFLVWNLPRG